MIDAASRDPAAAARTDRATLAQHLRAMRRGVACLVLTSFILSPYGVLAAGPSADTNAPANQTPAISAVGSVPVVNITTPGANGISHNKYQRFDVPTQGVVLNNSATAANSTLAGSIAGNPNLAGGSARVILNEVTSDQPSRLLGQIEVAGQAARVVVANPNGITCDGCGFINTPHVQLAAARPFFEGGILRFDLGVGRIDVGLLGLKALATRLDLIAGTIATTGPMESQREINFIAGGDASVDEDLISRVNGPRAGSTKDWQSCCQSPDWSWTAIDIGQSVSAGSVRLVLDSQAGRRIVIRSGIRAEEDVMVASRGAITIEAPITAARDIGIANREGMLEISNSLTPENPGLDAGRTIQILGFHGHARSTHLRAVQDIEIAMGQESVIGYSDYPSGEFPRLVVGNDLRLITGRGPVTPFWIERATVGRDLVAGPFGLKILPGLQGTAGAAHLLPADIPDPYRPESEAGQERLPDDIGGDFRGGIQNSGVIEVGRNAKLSYYSGPPLHVRNAELWGSQFSHIVADEDIVVKGIASVSDNSSDSGVERYFRATHGSIEAGRDIRFVNGYASQQLLFIRNLALLLNGHAGRDVIVESPIGFANFGQVSAGANIHIDAAGRVTNHGALDAGEGLLVAGQSLHNLGTIDAGLVQTAVSGAFENKGILHSASDVIVNATAFTNTPRVETTFSRSDSELYPGCTTGTIGTCTANVESAIGEARILAGRDIVVDAPVVHNIGGSLIAARNIDIATNDFINQDRELVADWSSTYTNIDGRLLTGQGTTAGTTVLRTIPGIIQAGGLFLAREWTPKPTPPAEDLDQGADGNGDSSGDDGEGSDNSAGDSGSGSATDTGNGSSTGGGTGDTRPPVVIVNPPPVAPPLVQPPPAVDRPPVDPPEVVAPPAVTPSTVTPPPVVAPPASPPLAPATTPSRFVNTGVIQAGAIVIHADEIRNGFDPVADYYRRTDPPTLPPATIALAAPLAQSSTTNATTQPAAGGDTLRKLLPAELGGNLPFALDAATEQAALRRAVQESTGRTVILPEALAGTDGLDAETRQWAALQANAAAFTLTHKVALGTALTEEQIAALDAPMLWYVEQDGQLVPQLVLPEADRARLAKLPGGLLQADNLVALDAEKITNTGTILSGGTLAIDARELSNLKRSTYYYDEHRVDGGTLITEGDVVQPGGFMQALRWSLAADQIDSRSGEFRLTGADETATQAASAALVANIAAALGEDFHYEQAQDNLDSRFIADKKKSGLSGLIGAVLAIAVAIVATPAVSAWVAGAAGATEAAAAGSAWAVGGAANVATTSFITGTVGSAAGQLAGTGRVDLDAALRNGLVAGLTTGIGNAALGGSSADSLAGLSNQSGTLQPVASGSTEWADRLLGIGARSLVSAGIQNAIVGSSFEAALRDALVGDLAALGANRIGGARLDTVSHALSHAALGAISAELTGKDAAAGAIGALTSALAAHPVDQALGLTGASRQAAVTALAMLSGGLASDALGHDPIAATNAALNEVTNNYLSHPQDLERRTRLARAKSDADRALIDAEYAQLNERQREEAAACLIEGICSSVMDPVVYRQTLDELNVACAAPRICSVLERQSIDELVRDFDIAQNAITPVHPIEELLLAGAVGKIAGGALKALAGRVFGAGSAATGDGTATSRAYLNEKFGRTGNLDVDITLRGYMSQVERLSVGSDFGKATFWSGPGNVTRAQLFARETGSITLEQTPGGAWLNNEVLFKRLPPELAIKPWEQLSLRYAEGTSGPVTAFVDGASSRGVFNRIEYPTISSNQNVPLILKNGVQPMRIR
ncbi:MAG: filamentous hemagglutinin N-terminal domain-containing protein [Sterolibacteriaceae bacterium]|nr:filamentous hemagglutinin N-terminal domain-containing protein [Sterolibacteriaceae bacterium]MBK9086113.1 filamentous hemagglutinin N-terminal domain-containing protein [Sterolibacteriaceae bacterium]